MRQIAGINIAAALMVGALVSCAGPSPITEACRTYDGEPLSKDKVAVLTLAGAWKKGAEVALIDGKPILKPPACDARAIELLPGVHDVHVTYYVSKIVGFGAVQLRFHAEAGRIYDFAVTGSYFSPDQCSIEDKTLGKVVARKVDCRAESRESWLKIWRARAECGDTSAVYKLVEAYEVIKFVRSGESGEEIADAYLWCMIAEKLGWQDALQCRSTLNAKLSEETREEFDRRVENWQPEVCSPPLK